MRRSLLLILVAALLGAGLLAGCGGDGGDDGASKTEEFDEAFKPINSEFLDAGQETQTAIQTADGKTNQALATQFAALSQRVASLRGRLVALDAPEEYAADVDRLAKSMQVIVDDLRKISEAATAGEAQTAKEQVQALLRHSVEVRTARRALARKTGAQQ